MSTPVRRGSAPDVRAARAGRDARDAVAIADAGVAAAESSAVLRAHLAAPPARAVLDGHDRVVCVSVGKAAAAMHPVLEDVVDPARWSGGVVVGLAGDRAAHTGRSPFVVGEHPFPGAASAAASRALRGVLDDAALTERDLVVLALSGGSSAMLCEPRAPLSISDVRGLTRTLLRSGLDVTTVNAVRQRVSVLAGGGLATAAWPATCWCLAVVDNVQDGVGAVGSGPTFPPLRPLAEVAGIVRGVLPDGGLRDRLLAAVRSAPEPRLDRVRNEVLCDPATALDAAERAARGLGYETVVLTSTLQGEARVVASRLGPVFRRHAGRGRPVCVLATGEVTVDLTGAGRGARGGRCQELAWAVAPEIAGCDGAWFAAVATDGCDFEPDAGGAVVGAGTTSAIRAAGLEWASRLDAHDTHDALAAVDGLLPSRTTRTNVCDVYVFTSGGVPGAPFPQYRTACAESPVVHPVDRDDGI